MKALARVMLAALLLSAAPACAVYIAPHPGVIYVQSAPPPPRVEQMLRTPGSGQLWIPGYWAWRFRAYVWVPGTWVMVEPGFHEWAPGHWARDHHGWFWIEGRWR